MSLAFPMLPLLDFNDTNISDACRAQVYLIFKPRKQYPFQLLMLKNYMPQQEMLPGPLLIIFCIPAVIIILLTVFGNLLVLFFKVIPDISNDPAIN